MDKIKFIPLAISSLFGLKLLVLGGNLESACILAVLGGISAFYEFKVQNKKIKDLEEKVESYNKTMEEKAKEIESLKTHVSSIKLGSQLRPASRV